MNPIDHRRFLLTVVLLTAAVLVLTVSSQIYDSNLYVMGESTALLAGDHPYQDFFEVGVPLAAYMAAGVQWLSGHRLLGEFVRQWIFVVAGVAIAFHLGLVLSRSVAASAAMLPLTLALLAATPTYHYAKLFFFPLLIWLGWRYLERPAVARSVALGVASALAFLYRHDYGVYAAVASIIALCLPTAARVATGNVRALARDCAAYGVVVALLSLPWAVAVEANEGLIEYTRIRADLYESPGDSAFTSLLTLNPVRGLTPSSPPPPRRAIVRFVWRDEVTAARQRQIESDYGLRPLPGRDAGGRWQYEVSNLYDPRLLDLDPWINDGDGFEWERLRELRWRLPPRDNLALWLQQMALVAVCALLLAAAVKVVASWRRGVAVPLDAYRMLLAGVVLAVIDASLFRERSYVVVVAPVTAALSATFLTGGSAIVRGVAVMLVAVTTVAAIIWARDPILRPTVEVLSEAYGELVATPAAASNPFRYLHECMTPGDRLLLTGQTPGWVSYYAQRPIAGGHVNWRIGWRSDADHEAESLALLERQSVPFAVATHGRVLDDFARYPRIRHYLQQHFRPIDGAGERILVDARRMPTRTFGAGGWPCFQ